MLDLYDELKKVITALDEQGIPYAVCGGLAVSIHVEPRATEDLDLLVLVQDLDRCQSAVEPLGFKKYESPMALAQGVVTLQRLLKLEPAGEDHVTLDLLLVGSPVLESVWRTRQNFEWESRKIWIVSREGLIELKRLRGSSQDLVDIEKLQEKKQ